MRNTLKIVLIHVAFWALFLGLWLFMRIDVLTIENVRRYILPLTFLVMVVFYLNYAWLFPRFYRTGKYFLYFSLILVLVLGLSFIQWMNGLFSNTFVINLPNLHPSGGVPFLSMIIGFTLATSLMIRLGQDNLKREREQQHLLNDRLNIEMDYLKSRVSPHFLLNSMNNIHAMVNMGNPKTSSMVAGVSTILRYLLYQTQRSEIMLSEEINLVKSFIEIQQIKSEYQNAVHLEIAGEFENVKIEPMLLLPLVENAFKHGNYDSVNGAAVNINISFSNNRFGAVIYNDCVVEKVNREANEGLGLKNVKSRLALRYPGKHQLNYDLRENVFRLTLSIDLS